MEVALTTSKGTLHKYISSLVSSDMSWLSIKAQLQERFSECGSSTMAKHKLTQCKQLDFPCMSTLPNLVTWQSMHMPLNCETVQAL